MCLHISAALHIHGPTCELRRSLEVSGAAVLAATGHLVNSARAPWAKERAAFASLQLSRLMMQARWPL